jgi:7-alpha-hydroxysteroid dehydrogenase
MGVSERFRLDGKVALLSGAGRGIGAASALALAEAGADIAVLARSQSQIDAVATAAHRMGRRAIAIAVDAHDEDAMDAAVRRTIDELGRLDVVVNVVGGSMPNAFMSTSDKALRESFEHNVVVGTRLVRQCVPHLLEQGGGSVVMISSTIGHLVGRGYAAYGLAKAAVDHSVRLMAADLSPRIRVNAVAPGAILTEALEVVAANPDIKAAIENGTPLRRLGDPDDIAAAVLYLASDASAYVTGQILAVDGGLVKPNLDMPFPDL